MSHRVRPLRFKIDPRAELVEICISPLHLRMRIMFLYTSLKNCHLSDLVVNIALTQRQVEKSLISRVKLISESTAHNLTACSCPWLEKGGGGAVTNDHSYFSMTRSRRILVGCFVWVGGGGGVNGIDFFRFRLVCCCCRGTVRYYVITGQPQQSTRHPTNVGSMLVHRLRRWPNIEPILGQSLVLPGLEVPKA